MKRLIETFLRWLLALIEGTREVPAERPTEPQEQPKTEPVDSPILTLSKAGVGLLCRLEGFRSEAYPDSAGVWTIGFGTTRYVGGSRVQPGDTVTREQARRLMADDAAFFAKEVRNAVTAPLTQEQFDALVIFAYNVGAHAFKTSTLLKKLNREHYSEAASEFPRWKHAGGRVVKGLVRRRNSERTLFTRGVYHRD